MNNSVLVTGTGSGSIGLLAENLNGANNGNVTVTQLGGASGGSYGIEALTQGNGNIAVEAAGAVTAGVQFGIFADSYGTGDVSVVTDSGSINSGGSGIFAVDQDTTIAASAHSTITVTAHGTINSGTTNNLNGAVPSGIVAGYTGNNIGPHNIPNANVNGTVVVNNYANITAAAGYGIEAYNKGQGDVTVNDFAGTSISGAQFGIGAYSMSGGNVAVSMSANHNSIDSGGIGIVALDEASSISSSKTITVTAHGTIDAVSGIEAGYVPAGSAAIEPNVAGSVTVDSDTTITASGAYGIDAFNWGTGNVTVSTGTGSSITASNATGEGINAAAIDGGDVSVTNDGAVSGHTGIAAFASGAGSVSVVNNGHITGFTGIGVTQNNPGATGSTTITNTVSVLGSGAAIFVEENATGTATIGNSGTIASTSSASGLAIEETGGDITVNNTGEIDGYVNLANGTFNNEAGGTWQVAGASEFGFNSTTGVVEAFTIDNAGTIDLSGSAALSGANGLDITNSSLIENLSGSTAISGATIDNSSGKVQIDAGVAATLTDPAVLNTLSLTNGTKITSGIVTVAANAVINSTGGANAIDGATLSVAVAGTLEVTGGTLTIDAASTVDNTGMFKADGGTLIVNTALAGDAEIDGASTLELGANSTVALPNPYGSANITFASSATGTLKLDHSEAFHGTVSGLDDNTLDLGDITSGSNTSVSYSGVTGILTVVSNTDPTQVAQIHLTGDYTGSHWLATSDAPGGGTDVVEIPGAITAGLNSHGNPSEGSPVTVSITDGGHSVASGATYEWQIWDTNQQKWIDGSGTGITGATYTPGEQDEGHLLQVSLTFTDANGNVDHTTVSAGTVSPVADVPVVTASAAEINEGGASALTLSLTNAADLFENGDDSVTITVSLDQGASLSQTGAGAAVTDNHDGTFTLTAASVADLSGLTITPTGEFEGTVNVGVSAVTHDGGAVSVAGTTSTTLTVDPVADVPVVTASAAEINEGGASALTLSLTNATDLFENGDDSVTITVSLDQGASLSQTGAGAAVTDNHDGTFTLTAASVADLSGLTITPTGEFEGTVNVGVSAVTHDGGAVSVAGTTSTTLTVDPVADVPVVTASAAEINEGGASALTLSLTNATDLFENGDDSVTITVSLDQGASLSQTGSGAAVTDNHDGTFTLTAASVADLAGLTITPTGEFEGTVNVGVSAVTHDGGAVSVAGTTSTTLTVDPVADVPVVTASAAEINEGGASALTLSLTNAADLFENGDDSVTITVSLDQGASLSQTGDGAAVTDNHDGTFTLTAASVADLAGLTITPTGEFEGTVNVGVSAVTHDGGAVSVAGTTSTTLTVDPVADVPVVTASAAEINEGGASALTLSLTNAADLFENGDDSVTITVSLDQGASLSQTGDGAAVTDNHDGTFTLTAHSTADLSGLTITPTGEFEGTVAVGVSAVTHDGTSDSTPATTSTTLTVDPVSDTPSISVPDTSTTAIAVAENANAGISVSVTPASGDADDPVTVTLSVAHGTLFVDDSSVAPDIVVAGDQSGTVTVSGLAIDVNFVLASLGYTPNSDYQGPDALHVTATSTDGTASPSAPAEQTVALIVTPVDDASVSLNGLSGSNAVEGQQVTAVVTDADAPSSGIIYTFETSSDGTNWTPVQSGSSASYTPGETDEGSQLQVSVSFTDTHNNAVTASASGGTVQESAADTTVTLAGLTDNNAVEGSPITASVSDPDAGSGIVYTWTVGDHTVTADNLAGNIYTPTEADEGQAISVSVWFTDSHGNPETGTASGGTVAESAADTTVTLAGLTDNNAVEGSPITASVSDPDAGSGIVYTWTVGDHTVTADNLAGNIYTPTEADEGQAISVSASFTDSHGNPETGTASGGTVAESAADTTVTLAGLTDNNAVEGSPITASVSDPDAGSGIVYTWTVGDHTVTADNLAGNIYTPTEADEGQAISVSVSFTDSHGNPETGTASGGTVQESAADTTVTLAGLTDNNAVEGSPITASVSDPDAGSGIVYTWTVGDHTVTADNLAGNIYTPTEADEGQAISVSVSFTDSHGNPETGTASGGTVGESAANDLVATLDSTTATEGSQINVTGVTDGGIAVASGISYDWQVCNDGGTTWTEANGTNGGSSYTPVAADDGQSLQLVVSLASDPTGTESSTYNLGTVQAASGNSGPDVWTGSDGPGDGTGDWNDAANWSLNRVPGSTDVAEVDSLDANSQVPTISGALSGNQSIAQLNIQSGAELDISNFNSGPSYTFALTGATSGDLTSAMQNAGLIDVQNATFAISANSTNFGTVQADGSNGIVSFAAVAVDQSGGGTISAINASQVDLNGTTVINGTISLDGGSTLNVSSPAVPETSTLDGVTVTGTSANGDTAASTIAVGAHAAEILLLDDGTSIANGALTIGSGSTLDIEVGLNGSGNPDATLDGVTVTGIDAVTGNNPTPASTIEVGATTGATLLLDDGTTIANGTLTIGSQGVLDVEVGNNQAPNGFDAALDGVIVTSSGTIQVDVQGYNGYGAVLSLDDGTIIHGGTLDIENSGELYVQNGSSSFGATLDGVTVTNDGAGIEIGGPTGSTLILEDGTTITGTTLTFNQATDVLEIKVGPQGQGGAGGLGFDAALNGVAISAADGGGTMEVDSGATLLLDGGAAMTNGTLSLGAGSALDVEIAGTASSNPDATLDGVTVNAPDFTSIIEVGFSTAATLLLDDGATINNATLAIAIGGTLEIAHGANDTGATLDNVTVSNSGTIEINSTAGDPTLTLDNGTAITGGGTLTIGGGDTLTLLDGASIGTAITFTGTGDTLNVDPSSSVAGPVSGFGNGDTIDFTGITSVNDPSFSYSSGVLTLTYFAADDTAHAHQLHETINLSGSYTQSDFALVGDQTGGTEILFQPNASVTVLTSAGLDFQTNPNPLTEMGSGTIQSGAGGSTFTVVDGGSSNEFVFDGYNFTYDGSGNVTGGTITAIHEFNSGHNAIVDFTGQFDAASWMADVKDAAGGDFSELNALVSSYNFTFTGGSGPDSFGGAGHSETLNGGAGNDTLDPGTANGGVHTLTGGAGSDTFVYGAGYGAVTITDFDQGNSGAFDSLENDQVQLKNLSGVTPTVGQDGDGNATASFGNGGDVLTFLHVTEAELNAVIAAGGGGGGGGGSGGGGSGGSSGPAITGAGNTVTYTGSPLFLDQSVAVTDSTGTVTSVNVWISSGYQTGDELTIDGNVDGQIVNNSDGSIIHYHFDPSANNNNNGIPAGGIFLYGASGTPTTADFQAALEMIQFTPGGADGDRTVTWAAQDANNSSPTATTTVHIDAPVVSTNNMALVAQTFFGSTGDENATGITYANGELYVVGDNPQAGSSPSAQSYVDLFSVNGATPVWSQAWQYGNFNSIAVASNEIYAAGAISAGDTSILPFDFDNEDKTLLVRFSANDGTELGFTSHTWSGSSGTTNFFDYKGVEFFSDIIATNQGGNTDLYAVGSGQPDSYDAYIIAKYDLSGDLLAQATDSSVGVTFSGAAPIPGSSGASGVVSFNGDIWALGYTAWPSDNGGASNGQAVVWEYDSNLNLLGRFKDTDPSLSGQNASFNGGAVLGNSLYAFGHASNSGGGQNYLIADYNGDGSIAWSKTFGDGNGDTLNGAVTLNGHLYVVGSETVAGVTEGVLMEIDPSSGNVLSTTIYDPAQYNSFTSITTDSHYLYIAGISGSSATQDQAVLLTYDAGGTTAQAVEDTTLTLSSLSVSDPAAGSAQIKVTLAASHGTIALENTGGLDNVQGAGTGSVELFGSQAAINAALAHGVVYDPALGYVGSDTLTVTANDQGHNASNSPHSTTQDISISIAPAADTIPDGGSLLVNSPSGDTVVFATGHGTLDLNQPSTFTGVIGDVTGTGDVLDSDVLDMHGFHATTTTATTGNGSFDITTDTTTLTVHDTNGNLTETFKLAGDLSASLWNVTDNNNGGVNIVDPPVSSGQVGGVTMNDPGPPASGGHLAGVTMNDPGPAASQIVASAPNQTLTGTGASNYSCSTSRTSAGTR